MAAVPFPQGGPGLAGVGAGRSRVAPHPEMGAALREGAEERGRAAEWLSSGSHLGTGTVFAASWGTPRGAAQAETAPGPPLSPDSRVAEGALGEPLDPLSQHQS